MIVTIIVIILQYWFLCFIFEFLLFVFLFIFQSLFVDRLRSQKVNSSYNDSTMPTSKFAPPTASGPDHPLGKNPRKSWSSIAYNNKNFPDGKLGYEHQQHVVASSTAGQRSSLAASSTGNYQHGTASSNQSTGNKLLSKGYSKFERSGQDVMARASQIVQ